MRFYQDCPPENRTIHSELDRESAIRWAIAEALPGDIVLVAGKGHETEQIVGSKRIPFDDRTICRNCLNELLEIDTTKTSSLCLNK